MRFARRVIIVVGASYVLLNLYSYMHPEWLCNILSIVALVSLGIALLVTAIRGFLIWRKSSRFWMVPTALSIVFILTAWPTPPLGRLIADHRFKSHLAEYKSVVEELRDGSGFSSEVTGANLSLIKAKRLPYDVRAVKAARCGNGAIVAAFLLDTDVPLLHEGYVYKGYRSSDTCVKDDARPENNWPYVRPVVGDWYHFSDQPGL